MLSQIGASPLTNRLHGWIMTKHWHARWSFMSAVLLCLSLAGYPLVATFGDLVGFQGSTLSVSFRALCLGLAIALIAHSRHTKLNRCTLSLYGLILLMLGLYGLRLVSNVILEPETLGRPPYVYVLFYFGVTLFPLIAIMLAPRLDLDSAFYLMLAIATISSALGYLDVKSTHLISSGRLQRGSLDNLNSISLGNVGVLLAILCVWAMVSGRATGHKARLVFPFLLLLGLGLSLLAASRGPLVSFATTLMVLTLLLRGRARLRMTALVALLAGIQVWDGGAGSALIIKRFVAFSENNDMSTSIRLNLYHDALSQIANHPIFGSSIEVHSYRFYPHNAFLEYFMATGILAGLTFFLLTCLTVWRGAQLIRKRDKQGWVYLLFLESLVGAMFSGALYSSQMFWITMAVTLSLTCSRSAVRAPAFPEKRAATRGQNE